MHNQSCKNGCEFANQVHLMSYAAKNSDGTYSDADYLYKCTKIDKIVSFDSTVYELGCASFNNECQNARVCEAESLISEVEKRVEEIEKTIPVVTSAGIPEPVIPAVVIEKPAEPTVVEPVVERVEPRFVPEPTVVKSAEQTEKPKSDTTKKRGRRTAIEASVANPVVPEVPKE